MRPTIKTHFDATPRTYDGSQLRSHFAYKTFGILGDSIVGFAGPCDVKTASMVDLEDATRGLHIYSENMLHFIVERFDDDLTLAITLQRLLVANAIAELQDGVDGLRLVRRGNDIFDETCKLSVSIATVSPVSTLIHFGINIVSRNTPVPTKGLEDYGLTPPATARGILNRYAEESVGIAKARAKVRGVA